MKMIILAVALAVALVVACGGSSGRSSTRGRTLHLAGVDVSEDLIRIYTHGSLTENSKDGEEFCAKEHTTQEWQLVIWAAPNGGMLHYVEDGMPGYRERPGQVANPDDELRVVQIIQEECDRILQP